MKILELYIKNIRGIKEISIKPNGKNFVVSGPNGTGKSAVVDALDFLFTGDISRLKGEGTSGISLKEHGPHIDSEPKETIVRATIKMPNSENICTVERSISNPDKLKIISGDPKELSEALEIAKRGQHVLSRREILKYIAAQRGERSKEIQALLNLQKVGVLRALFVSTENEAAKQFESVQKRFALSFDNLRVKLSIPVFTDEAAIEAINVLRKTLNGSSIGVLEKDKLKENLIPPTKTTTVVAVNPQTTKAECQEIQNILGKKQELQESLTKIIAVIKNLELNKELLHQIKCLPLI